MGDGCSGVFDYGYKKACDRHDKAYHEGGGIVDKLIADGKFHRDMCATPGFWGWMAREYIADRRYAGVRMLTFNYPPGHPERVDFPGRVEAFNWKGPGPA